MRKQTKPQGISKKIVVPVFLAHVVCCGGILLWPVIGSAVIAGLGGVTNNPALQIAGLMLLAGGAAVLWRRVKIKGQTRSEIGKAGSIESRPDGEAS